MTNSSVDFRITIDFRFFLLFGFPFLLKVIGNELQEFFGLRNLILNLAQ